MISIIIKITSDTFNTFLNIGGILCFLVPAYELIFNKKKKGVKRVTPVGLFLIFLGLYNFGFTYFRDKYKKAEDDSAQVITDSTNKANRVADIESTVDKVTSRFNMALKKEGYVYEPKTNSIKIDAEKPLIEDFTSDVPSSYLTKNNNEIKYNLTITNFKNAAAYNLRNSLVNIVRLKGIDSVTVRYNHNSFYPGQILRKGTGFTIETRGTGNLPDSLYIYAKISYTDSLNKPQTPFRRIFLFVPSILDRQMYDANYEEYNRIKALLISKKLW